ncbi:MAG: glycoside hydrolase domain-containing protein [Candidatus Omnitrophota bacterium]
MSIRMLFCLLMVLWAGTVWPGEILNKDFESGETVNGVFTPSHWNPPIEHGAAAAGYSSQRAISVTGHGDDDAAWRSDPVALLPGDYYEFSFWGKAESETSNGSAVSGPAFANRDIRLTPSWQRYAFVFRVPDGCKKAVFRLGHWRVNGTLTFDDVNLYPVQPIYHRQNGIELGSGERIEGDTYSAEHRTNDYGSNSCRFLAYTNTRFNSPRWLFDSSSCVIYRHEAPAGAFQKASVEVNLNDYSSGVCQVSVRKDGGEWTLLGAMKDASASAFSLPESLLFSKTVEIKLEGAADEKGSCSFQVDRYQFESRLDKTLAAMQCESTFARILQSDPQLDVLLLDAGNPRPQEASSLRLQLTNKSDNRLALLIQPEVKEDKNPRKGKIRVVLKPREKRKAEVPYSIEASGSRTLCVRIADNRKTLYETEIPFFVSCLYEANYGQTLQDGGVSALWWCPSTYKISVSRPIPRSKGKEVQFSAAKGEFEPAQVVLRPKQAMKHLRIMAEDLSGPSGARIPAKNISMKQVEYVSISNPSDAWGCVGLWPDPLPLADEPLNLEAGRNYPFWITIQIPRDVPGGIYKGRLHLQADGWEEQVPLRLKVYDFEIPAEFHLRTAFGFSPGLVKRYHHLDAAEELDQTVDLYLQNFRDHRISPYNPTMLHPIRYELRGDFTFDFADFDKAGKRYFDEFGFTGLHLSLVGMGGGTFHSRHKGRIGDYEQGTPEYERLFKQYASTIENHLREKGWLDKAYIYWFDEPDPKDYEFVKEGMERIRHSAPGLKRMLTEQPEKELAGFVDIWCPIIDQYDPVIGQQRQKEGDAFWWYVCTGPKQPYPGLFIDHPAVDMRSWIWMTQKYGVQGCLVWESNYWTSGLAYPEPEIQNPWTDPMSYLTGYGHPVGFKGHWGNGDGRFIYPPRSWNDGQKRICGPVDSIRWEMLREGIEDYEYFYMISELAKTDRLPPSMNKQAQKLLDIPETIIRSRTEYAKDPAAMLEYRDRLGIFLEKALRQ